MSRYLFAIIVLLSNSQFPRVGYSQSSCASRGEDHLAVPSQKNGTPNPSDLLNHEDIDTDQDGLSDLFEINFFRLEGGKVAKLDPFDRDTDDDGLIDGHEYYAGNKAMLVGSPLYNALDFWGKTLGVDPWLPDSDFDGIPDGTELGATEPIEGFITVYDGKEVQIKGTDIHAKFEFSFLAGDLPQFSDTEKHLIKQNRYCFRPDSDSGYESNYFTHPFVSDSNNDGIIDGLQDYCQASTIKELTDEEKYNAPTNYNGKFDVGELDAQSGLYSVPPHEEGHVSMYLDGGFYLYGQQRAANLQPSSHVSTPRVRLIRGPELSNCEIRIQTDIPEIEFKPNYISCLNPDICILILVTTELTEISDFRMNIKTSECSAEQ